MEQQAKQGARKAAKPRGTKETNRKTTAQKQAHGQATPARDGAAVETALLHQALVEGSVQAQMFYLRQTGYYDQKEDRLLKEEPTREELIEAIQRIAERMATSGE